jgi:hypothetical protein
VAKKGQANGGENKAKKMVVKEGGDSTAMVVAGDDVLVNGGSRVL